MCSLSGFLLQCWTVLLKMANFFAVIALFDVGGVFCGAL